MFPILKSSSPNGSRFPTCISFSSGLIFIRNKINWLSVGSPSPRKRGSFMAYFYPNGLVPPPAALCRKSSRLLLAFCKFWAMAWCATFFRMPLLFSPRCPLFPLSPVALNCHSLYFPQSPLEIFLTEKESPFFSPPRPETYPFTCCPFTLPTPPNFGFVTVS